MKYSRGAWGIFSACLMLVLVNHVNAGAADFTSYLIPSGISSTLTEMKDLISGISNFIGGIISVTRLIGFSTFVLFLFILIFSSGLSSIGFPRGWQSFLISVAAADFIWIVWKESFNPPTMAYLKDVMKSNLIILVPVSFFYLAKWSIPVLAEKIRARMRQRYLLGKSSISRSDSIKLSDDFIEEASHLQKLLNHDILNSEKDRNVVYSPETIAGVKRIKEILSVIDK